MKLSINSRICWFAPLPALASAAVLLAGPTARSADELRAYWPLDENSGTVVPNESTTADATINSGATWVAGTINNALNFNGVNQYVTGAVTVPLTDTAVSMWFRTTQSGGACIVPPMQTAPVMTVIFISTVATSIRESGMWR